MGLRADITAAAGRKKEAVRETYSLSEILASALKFLNQGLMESMSDVIIKHPRGSLLLLEQRGKEDAATAASSDTLHRFNSVFSIPHFMLTRSNKSLRYMLFLEMQDLGARKLAA